MVVEDEGGGRTQRRRRVQSEFGVASPHVIAGVDPTVGPYLFRTNNLLATP